METLPDASQTQATKWVPGWLTTSGDHVIELWHSGFNGVPAAHGSQFAEPNARQVATLYQDLPTTPGSKLYWRLYHRGRTGQDTMALDIGAPGSAVEQRRFTDGNTAWSGARSSARHREHLSRHGDNAVVAAALAHQREGHTGPATSAATAFVAAVCARLGLPGPVPGPSR